jgi:hypothetical protein
MTTPTQIEAGRVVIRHIRRRLNPAVGEPGEIQVLDTWMVPQPLKGLDTPDTPQWKSATPERRLGESGPFTLTLANGVGGDGLPHLERFLVIADRADYQPGDEFLEFYDVAGAGPPAGDPFYVGTPTTATIDRASITISGEDALALLNGARETAAGFWHHAPRDVFAHYTQGWTAAVADDFQTTPRFTYSTASAITGDGRWRYARCADDAGRGAVALVDNTDTTDGADRPMLVTTTAITANDSDSAWRLEASVENSELGTFILALSAEPAAAVAWGGDDTISISAQPIDFTGTTIFQIAALPGTYRYVDVKPITGKLTLTIEGRGNWIFYYANGQLLGVLPMVAGGITNWYARVAFATNVGAPPSTAITGYVTSLLLRQARNLLLADSAAGDMHLPGEPPPGGLIGEYYSDVDIQSSQATECLSPVRKPAARRQDAVLAFATADPPTWQPVQASGDGDYFSVRWTGAIYLDLQASDRKVRINAPDDGVRVWIGRTRRADRLIDAWAYTGAAHYDTPALQNLLGTQAGWYPIVIEYYQAAGLGGLGLQDGPVNGAGAYTSGPATVPAARLSPLGCFTAQVRYDSHYEVLQTLKNTFGLQFTCQPRRLESGEFPGQVIPRVRHGRDTDHIVDALEGVQPRTQIDASQTIGTLLADAQGIATDGAQLTQEAVDFTRLDHLLIRSDYESLSDISIDELVLQRITTILGLRGRPWEEVSVRPPRKRDYADSFPLTGAAAKFEWEPGDGVRLQLRQVAVVDQTPRQVLGVQWPCTPGGRGKPVASFRQRPRNTKLLLRSMLRAALNPQRNYQGQLTIVRGDIGATTGAGADSYSRVSTPHAASAMVKAELVVHRIVGSWSIEVGGVDTTITVDHVGRYDVTAAAVQVAGDQQIYARLISGGTAYEISLELTVRI